MRILNLKSLLWLKALQRKEKTDPITLICRYRSHNCDILKLNAAGKKVLGGTSFRPLIFPSDPPFSLNISIDACDNICFYFFIKSSTRFKTVFLFRPSNTCKNLAASSFSKSWLKVNAFASPIQVLKSKLLHSFTTLVVDSHCKTDGKLSLGSRPGEMKMEDGAKVEVWTQNAHTAIIFLQWFEKGSF